MVLMPMMVDHLAALATVANTAQWHMLGMLAPAVVAGALVDRYGTRPIALAGMAITGLATIHPTARRA